MGPRIIYLTGCEAIPIVCSLRLHINCMRALYVHLYSYAWRGKGASIFFFFFLYLTFFYLKQTVFPPLNWNRQDYSNYKCKTITCKITSVIFVSLQPHNLSLLLHLQTHTAIWLVGGICGHLTLLWFCCQPTYNSVSSV